MSEGSCILVRESVKLLKAVYTYQSYRLGYKSDVNIASLFDVRGAMLKNAMSRTIYHNYIGLVYMNKAMTIINNCFTSFNKSKIDVLSIEAAKILEHLTKSQDKDLAIIYLKEAIANFDSAVQTIRDELMWNAFIQYNKARSQYILSRLCETGNTTWQETMAVAIEYRSKLVMILNDILGVSGKSYLQRAFIDQLKLAQLMNVRLKLAVGSNIDNDCWSYDIGIDEFNRLTDVKEDIYNHIEKQTTIKPKNKKRNK